MIINGEPTYSDLNKPLGLKIGNDYTMFSDMFLINTSKRFTDTTDLNTESTWLAKIKVKDIIPITDIINIEPLTEQTTFQKSLLDFSYVAKPGKYIYRLNYNWDYEYYQKVEELSGQRYDVILVDDNNNVYVRQNGSALSGLTARLIVEKPVMGSSESNFSNVYLELEEPDEIKEVVTIKSDLYFHLLYYLTVDINKITLIDTDVIWFNVTDSIYGCPILGIEETGFTITDYTNGVLTITGISSNGEGLYKLTLSDDVTTGTIAIDTPYYGGTANYALAGATWSSLTSGTAVFLSQISMKTDIDGYVCGNSGFIARTINGTSWSSQTSGTSNSLESIAAFSSLVVCAVGQSSTVIFSTNDGGTWSAASSPPTETQVEVIEAFGGLVFRSCGGSGNVYLSADNGDTWSGGNSGTANTLSSIVEPASNRLHVCGAGGVIQYYNGFTWAARTSTVVTDLLDLFFISSVVGWCVGSSGVVLKTSDSGTTWAQISTITGESLKAVCFVDANNGYTVSSSGKIFKSINGGTTWNEIHDEGVFLNSIDMRSNSLGFACGNTGTILKYS